MPEPHVATSRSAGGDSVPERVAARLDAEQMNDIVTAVVERIETRVVDELERRGRRHGYGGF